MPPARGRFARILPPSAVHEFVNLGGGVGRHFLEVALAQLGVVPVERPIDIGALLAFGVDFDKGLDMPLGQFTAASRNDAPDHFRDRPNGSRLPRGSGTDQHSSPRAALRPGCRPDLVSQVAWQPLDVVRRQFERGREFRRLGHDRAVA